MSSKYQIWYSKPEFFAKAIMGLKYLQDIGSVPVKSALADTHVHLMEKEAHDLDNLYVAMQGENWSPEGEGRVLIESRGLSHTSMSIGDVAVNAKGVAWMCDTFGWVELK